MTKGIVNTIRRIVDETWCMNSGGTWDELIPFESTVWDKYECKKCLHSWEG